MSNKRGILDKIFGRNKVSEKYLIVPSYDAVTSKTSEWASTWEIPDALIYKAREASHKTIRPLLNSSPRSSKLFMFVGHGRATGLLTEHGLGKAGSPASCEEGEALVDTDDISPKMRNVYFVAWACEAGSYFGSRLALQKASGFLGFDGAINFVFNQQPSERLWSEAMEKMFSYVARKGTVESHDAEWLQKHLLELRRKLKRREIDTGKYNRLNSAFLKAAARAARVHITKG